MRIRIWNAFASNNSGSYTIVGSFDSDALAAEVAGELAELMAAHTAWLDGRSKPASAEESPLRSFVRKRDLTWYEGMGTDDEWPQYSKDNTPQAFAVGCKVVLHHNYTVTMPRVFGEYFYARGGRVESEMNHAHHPIVGLIEMWIPWKQRKGVDVAARVSAIVEALNADDGPLSTGVPLWHQPAWQTREGFGEADLALGVIFDDMASGFTTVHRIAAVHGLQAGIKLFEALDENDPVSFLRPSSPALRALPFSVVLDEPGPVAKTVSAAVAALLRYDSQAATNLLASPRPVVVKSGLILSRAEKVAAFLRDAGASVSIVVDR